MLEEGLEVVIFSKLRFGGGRLLLNRFPSEAFSLVGASFLFGVCDLTGVFACDGGFFLFVVAKGLQHFIVGLGLFAFPFIGSVSAFLHVLLIHSSFGRLVICLLIFGQSLFSRECLVGLFEFFLPFLDLLKLSLVVEINLLELLLEALVHHLKVGVFDALACVAGELFDFGHRLGLLSLFLLELVKVFLIGGGAGLRSSVIRLAGHGSILILSFVLSLFKLLHVFEASFTRGCLSAHTFQQGISILDLLS